MSTGTSKTRSKRLAMIAAMPNRMSRTISQLQRRDVLIRIVTLVVAFFLLLGLLQVWNPPFPYYVGAPVSRDIVARVAFAMPNPEETQLEREKAGLSVPYVFVRESSKDALQINIKKLYEDLREAQEAGSLEKIPHELREKFLPLEEEEAKSAAAKSVNVFEFLHRPANSPASPAPVPPPATTPPAASHSPVANPPQTNNLHSLPVPVSPSTIHSTETAPIHPVEAAPIEETPTAEVPNAVPSNEDVSPGEEPTDTTQRPLPYTFAQADTSAATPAPAAHTTADEVELVSYTSAAVVSESVSKSTTDSTLAATISPAPAATPVSTPDQTPVP
ncbi:MAG: hypothetical protein Q4D38_14085, partial [Planctomycetia bacterium]|nr:hypothetical protein [Planctomycetia bacterium]